MPYNTMYVWAAYETLGSTNLNSNFANMGYLKTKADRAIWPCKVFYPSQNIVSGDGQYYLAIPELLDGYDLIGITGKVWTASSSGTIDIMVFNQSQFVDMLSTALTIDANEYNSGSAAIPAVIDTANDDVAAFNSLRIDVDSAGTGAQGLQIDLIFYLT